MFVGPDFFARDIVKLEPRIDKCLNKLLFFKIVSQYKDGTCICVYPPLLNANFPKDDMQPSINRYDNVAIDVGRVGTPSNSLEITPTAVEKIEDLAPKQ
ncbi:hypothetical protein AVEN_249814-1 [Araneus ventricosus]|uniref:Uncharacterized protein n=1 Tax=Araneus ventricosus TaxID=182803 RepID=A0A4Y2RFG2_ARAVE|nr:hypothetical protein AVEN_249814-1 [Araneus ventricosus]